MANESKLSLLAISAFCESLSGMLDAGIDISEAVSLLKRKDDKSGVLNDGVNRISKSLEEGSTLSEAMKESGMFPKYVLDMVETGETTGNSAEALARLSSYYSSQHSLSEKIKATIVYPMAMIVLIIIVLFLMLKTVLPAFANVYETLTGSLSESSFAYINYAFLFCRIALILMSVLVIGVGVAYLLYRSGHKKQIASLIRMIPGASAIMEDMALYRFTSAFEVYLASGYVQDDAVEKAAQMADHEEVERKIEEVKKQMAEGHGFASAANDAGLYEPVYGRMLIPAEKSGHMDETLTRLTELLKNGIENGSDKLLSSLESVLSGILMVTVAIALLCVMLPLIGIMNSIG